MKQRIVASYNAPTSGFNIQILSVHQLDDQLLVMTKITCPEGGLVLSCFQQMEDAVTVKTDATQQLPVKYFLTNMKKDNPHAKSMRASLENNHGYGVTSPFLFIDEQNEEEINGLLAKSKCLYKPRTDNMIALRYGRIENARSEASNISQLTIPNTNPYATFLPNNETQYILNIYPEIDSDTIKITLESITPAHSKKQPPRIVRALEDALNKLPHPKINLEKDFYMTEDDTFRFTGINRGISTEYETTAIEFTLPSNIKSVFAFMRLLDDIMPVMREDNDYTAPYQLIQISQQSILSAFEDYLISGIQTSRSGRHQINSIENDMSMSMNKFINLPGTVHQVARPSQVLLEAIQQAGPLIEYTELQAFIKHEFQTFGFDIITNPSAYFEKIFGLPVNTLLTSTDTTKKLDLAEQLEHTLLSTKPFKNVKFLLSEFNHAAIAALIKPALCQKAPDGGHYNWSYTEFDLLFNAKFCLREDGRMSILLADNAGYQKHYGKHSRNHAICQAEFEFLAKVLKLEFASDTDFHQEMIFTPASTQTLKACGVHINETYLTQQAEKMLQNVKQSESKLSASALTMFSLAKQNSPNGKTETAQARM